MYILSTVGVVFVGRLVCSALLEMSCKISQDLARIMQELLCKNLIRYFLKDSCKTLSRSLKILQELLM